MIFKFDHALFWGNRIKENREIQMATILFDPVHFNDV
jgi:hypothetical protein